MLWIELFQLFIKISEIYDENSLPFLLLLLCWFKIAVYKSDSFEMSKSLCVGGRIFSTTNTVIQFNNLSKLNIHFNDAAFEGFGKCSFILTNLDDFFDEITDKY